MDPEREPPRRSSREPARARPPRYGSIAASCAALGIVLTALLAPSLSPAAEIIEQTIKVPVTLQVPGGPDLRQDIAVTIIRESATDRRPFLVLLHGRGASQAERTAMGLKTYPANSRYFASMGFVVLVPTRVGYGVSGGPDVEYTGTCASKRFADGAEIAVSQTRQVLAFAERLPYVDPDHGIVVGESFGGLAAIAIASDDIRGLVAAINISGGDGGNARNRPDEPCRPDQMREAFARYGSANRLPTLWMYSANDRVWGPVYPRQWFAAFTRAGGRGQFIDLPADKNNGHYIFNRNAAAWHPAFEGFVSQLELVNATR
ncbi:MAG: alpha/beta fold hydrolase [Steroidobacteraceae bacterium]|nr:alpha/beta fold hydrolase [Steroidobacteraceae bacterium]